ncbi:hypothetical protein IAR50_002121 [Cryptococcus sp. DSM 104548]
MKARAARLQQEKEEAIKRELEIKQRREKEIAKEQEERRKQQEAASKEARRKELMRMNDSLTKKPDSKAVHVDYDPFAEDVKRPVSVPAFKPNVKTAAAKASSVKPGGASAPGRTASSKTGPLRSGTSGKSSNTSLTATETRKERAARLFAEKAKKSAGESLFSVRALVESREPVVMPPLPQAGATKISKSLSKGAVPGRGRIPSGNIKSRKGAEVDELRKLCPDRDTRDRRSVDEVARDLKAKRSKATFPPVMSTARSLGSSKSPAISPKRRRSPSSESVDSDDSIVSPPPKRRQGYLEEPPRSMISAEIQALFRRPGGAPQRRYDDDFSDSSSDMEAGLEDVEGEERKAARAARMEDEAAEREEREHRARKEALKKQRMKAGRT